MKLPKKVIIAGTEWKVVELPKKGGGSFNTYDRIMKIGTEAKQHVFGIFLHEVIEAILVMRDIRYEGTKHEDDYIFNMNHAEMIHFVQDLEVALKDFVNVRTR